ncbi:TPA: SDR family oxidoreductase [Pseudomonas aeruginosa]|nr:SDR family oxidoreductase [Pseudomonas aeruginosa]HCG0372705.1 SDR family oxidoreductase [Pseudomonas aeruginosa]HCG0391805.1 SDR family oxidoreductase [Pseudomonas aeruginosa]
MSETSKVALITGSSRGIGAALAQRLAGEGFRVIVNYAGSAGPAAAVVASIEAAGGQALALQADVVDPVAVGVMFEEVERAFQGIDVVVNCAGVMQLASVADSDDQLFDRTVAINFKGTFNVCREAARRLRDGGRIINFSSSVIGMRSPTYGVYIATKAAVEGVTQVLAQEMRGRGITVNAVAPGPVATALFLDGKSPELIERMSRVAPLERLGEPGDIAEVVAFLAGPQGGWVNGQVVRANGGLC